MEMQTKLPDGWKQLALPSLWEGMHVNHLVAPDYESEYETSSIIVSLIVEEARTCEEHVGRGRWADLGIRSGTLCCLPFRHGGRVRTEGSAEVINVYIDVWWLRNEIGSELAIFDRPIIGMQDKVSKLLMEEIYKDNQLGMPNGPLYSESLVLSLLYRMNAKSMQNPIDTRVMHDRKLVNIAIDYIYANLHDKLSLGEIAGSIGYDDNLFAFARLMKRYTGKGVHRYVMDARLEKAKSLLLAEGLSVTEVAFSCGFINMSHFSTAFKRRWGVTPSMMLRAPGLSAVLST